MVKGRSKRKGKGKPKSKRKGRGPAKSEQDKMAGTVNSQYVNIFLTFSSYLIATQEQPIFDAIYNLMKDAQQWRTQFMFFKSCTDNESLKVAPTKKVQVSSKKKGNQAAENMAGKARSFYSIINCLQFPYTLSQFP